MEYTQTGHLVHDTLASVPLARTSGTTDQNYDNTPNPAEGETDEPAGDGSRPGSDGGSDDGEPTTEESESLSLDVVFEIAKNERRRLVLRFLREADGPVSLSDLAEHVAAEENDKPIQQLTSSERKRVYVGLYQCHLPKMDDAGVVDFDRNPGITLGRNADQFDDVLDYEDDEPRWYRYYGGLAAAGGALVALTWAVAGAGSALPGAVALVALCAVGCLAVVQLLDAADS